MALAQQKFINILTGGQSGVYYPMGVALSQIYAKALPAAKVTVQATKASAENLNLLQAGRGEIAFTLADSLSDAWTGAASRCQIGYPYRPAPPRCKRAGRRSRPATNANAYAYAAFANQRSVRR